ncbi:MAG: ABC transporter ATP-binding protein, partial [Lautropia sp.]
MSAASLRADGLSKKFGGLVVLDGCSLRCEPGCITGLVGPNGSGKSTLFNVLTGIVRADAGEVALGTLRLTNRRPHEIVRAGIARTFQTTRLFKSLTVVENVLIGRGATSDDVPSVDEATTLLKRLNIGQLAARTADALSFGQQRLVELARVMMSRPRFILLDEPFAGLAPQICEDLQRHVTHLAEEGIGI